MPWMQLGVKRSLSQSGRGSGTSPGDRGVVLADGVEEVLRLLAAQVHRPQRDIRGPEGTPGGEPLAPALRIPAVHPGKALDLEGPGIPALVTEVREKAVTRHDRRLVVRPEQRQPAVSHPGHPPQGGLSRLGVVAVPSAEPDGDTASGPRVNAHPGEVVELALELDVVLLPQHAQDPNLLFLPPAPAGVVDAHGGVLEGCAGTGADPEAEATAGEEIHLGRLLGDEEGLAEGKDQDAADELDSGCQRRQLGEKGTNGSYEVERPPSDRAADVHSCRPQTT